MNRKSVAGTELSPQTGKKRSSGNVAADKEIPASGEKEKKASARQGGNVVTVQVTNPPPEQTPKCRHPSRYEREKRRWIADTVRDIAIAIFGGLISFTVSLLISLFAF